MNSNELGVVVPIPTLPPDWVITEFDTVDVPLKIGIVPLAPPDVVTLVWAIASVVAIANAKTNKFVCLGIFTAPP